MKWFIDEDFTPWTTPEIDDDLIQWSDEQEREMTFRQLVQEYLDENQMKTSHLSRLSGIDNGSLWRILNDNSRKSLTLRSALRIMRATGIPMTELDRIEELEAKSKGAKDV